MEESWRMHMKTPETNTLFSPGTYLFIPGWLLGSCCSAAATSSFASLHEQATNSGNRLARVTACRMTKPERPAPRYIALATEQTPAKGHSDCPCHCDRGASLPDGHAAGPVQKGQGCSISGGRPLVFGCLGVILANVAKAAVHADCFVRLQAPPGWYYSRQPSWATVIRHMIDRFRHDLRDHHGHTVQSAYPRRNRQYRSDQAAHEQAGRRAA